MNILLVDDEPIIHRAVGRFLTRFGHELTTAFESSEALRLLETQPTDLIISDIKMPGMDGLDLLEKLKVRAPAVPVVLITGHGDTDTAISALHKGAFSYLCKPVKLEDLISVLHRVEMQQHLVHSLPPHEEAKTNQSTRLLVVEPDRDLCAQMATALDPQAYQLSFCNNGQEGLDLFGKGVFDLVVSEIDLEPIDGIDGIEMVHRMRALEPTLVAMVTTKRQDQQAAVQALEGGARIFLTKPFTGKQFAAKISAALAVRQQVIGQHRAVEDLLRTRTQLQTTVAKQDQLLTDAEQYLHALIDAAPFAILSTDSNHRILTFNSTAEAMYGLSAWEVIGQSIALVFGENHSRPSPRKERHQRQDGSRFPVLIHRRKIADINDQPVARLYVVEDLTEHQQLEAQLLQAQRLSLLGELAPRIAHEVKTPLQLITGYTELAMQWLAKGQPEQASSSLELILPAAQQMQDMVQQISNLGRPPQQRRELLNLPQVLDQVLDNLEDLKLIKYCQIQRNYPSTTPLLVGDPSQFEQLFRNLLINAAQAMETSTTRNLSLELTPLEDDRLEVVVADTGNGIPPPLVNRVFEPFVTTKAEGKGTGLGLAIVKTIVERHQGTIRLETNEGTGTRFYLAFPTAPGNSTGAVR